MLPLCTHFSACQVGLYVDFCTMHGTSNIMLACVLYLNRIGFSVHCSKVRFVSRNTL